MKYSLKVITYFKDIVLSVCSLISLHTCTIYALFIHVGLSFYYLESNTLMPVMQKIYYYYYYY